MARLLVLETKSLSGRGAVWRGMRPIPYMGWPGCIPTGLNILLAGGRERAR